MLSLHWCLGQTYILSLKSILWCKCSSNKLDMNLHVLWPWHLQLMMLPFEWKHLFFPQDSNFASVIRLISFQTISVSLQDKPNIYYITCTTFKANSFRRIIEKQIPWESIIWGHKFPKTIISIKDKFKLNMLLKSTYLAEINHARTCIMFIMIFLVSIDFIKCII